MNRFLFFSLSLSLSSEAGESATKVLGITLGVVLVIIFIFWFCKRCVLPRRKKRRDGKKSTAVDINDDKVIEFASKLNKQLVGILRILTIN